MGLFDGTQDVVDRRKAEAKASYVTMTGTLSYEMDQLKKAQSVLDGNVTSRPQTKESYIRMPRLVVPHFCVAPHFYIAAHAVCKFVTMSAPFLHRCLL